MELPTEAELIAAAEQIQLAQPDISPLQLVLELCTRVLAAAFPAKSASILAGDYHRVVQSFAFDILGANGKPASMWMSEEQQKKHYGGIEALLFGNYPDGIFDHYGKMIGRVDNPPVLDPELAAAEAELGG
jgi:hypothetical protein